MIQFISNPLIDDFTGSIDVLGTLIHVSHLRNTIFMNVLCVVEYNLVLSSSYGTEILGHLKMWSSIKRNAMELVPLQLQDTELKYM